MNLRVLLLVLATFAAYSTQLSWASSQACVGNLVWLDKNANGIKDNGESGFPGIEVALYRSNKVIDQVVTSNGYFQLCAPTAGEYQLKIQIPEGYVVSIPNAGTSDHKDSDSDANGVINVLARAGKRQTKFDFGLTLNDSVTQYSASPNSAVSNVAVSNFNITKAPPIYTGENSILFGPWVESRHRNDGVFDRFNAALLWTRSSNILSVLEDARNTNTSLILQLGSVQEWGWNFQSNSSRFTLAKWKRSVDRFANNATIKRALNAAIADGVIRAIYLIDEPHHKRWSPGRNSYKHITNADIDEMARYIKSYWPAASTAVRASPRTLFSYGRANRNWRYLDEAFLMINYRKWKKFGKRTVEDFMEREIAEANRQGLGLIGSIQMLIGGPYSDKDWWSNRSSSGAKPTGKLKVSPDELETYVEAFLQPRNAKGEIDSNGVRRFNDIMIFRWDRNNERDWKNRHYSNSIDDLNKLLNAL
jgi:hypothetical protein